MRRTNSPMRYPGSKAVIADYIAEILLANHMHGATFVEPFCGGASVALDLLYTEKVSQIYLNDVDYRLYSFWRSIQDSPEEFIEKLRNTPVTMDERNRQTAIYRNQNDFSSFELGFATFFLNKVNRSGILTGGPIGGTEQSGPWKITTKFGKEYFYRTIRKFARYRPRIHLYWMDAAKFLERVVEPLEHNTFIYLDPPYFHKGKELYRDHHFTREDHSHLADVLKRISKPWLLSYDDVPQIRELYQDRPVENLSMYYHTYSKKHRDEILVYGNTTPLKDENTQVRANNMLW